jgi:DNA helicase-2/ATP-dependent DNA helicase PcrA
MEILENQAINLLNNLNNPQLEAVTSSSYATLVIAGAGSGKTSVLTRRVAFLIANKQLPGEILCLTFTNKAAKEMNHRVNKLLQENGIFIPYNPVWKTDYVQAPLLCTFHSLGVRILREFGEHLDLHKEFNILDSEDQKKIIRDILKELNVDQKNLQPSLILYFISKCKQELLTAGQSKQISQDFLPIFHQVYGLYESKLKSNHTIDFDDLILLPYLILKDNPEVRDTLQKRWKQIMIDEFQDTNPAQFELVKLLTPAELLKNSGKLENSEIPERSLFVVGDDAQSIYGFRGSKVEIILNFDKEYPKSKEVVLNQNYRSTQAILDLAEKVLSHNPHQKKKQLFTENPELVKVRYYLADNERDEAEYIIRQLYNHYVTDEKSKTETKITVDKNLEIEFIPDNQAEKTVKKSSDPISSMFDVYLETEEFAPTSFSSYNPNSWQVPSYNWETVNKLNDCVILYRTHAQSRSLEETFLKYHLPYRLVSGTRFLDRKEIRDVIAILKFMANGEDKFSLARFLPLVMDGVGPKTMEKIFSYLEDYEYPLAPKYQGNLLELFSALQFSWQEHDNLIDLTKSALSSSGYLKYLQKAYPIKEERDARMENIGEIYSLMFPFDEDKTVDLSTRLRSFLEQISLMSKLDDNEEENSPKINLMSLHQSKGLEFETVFLVGVEDGLLPHQNALFNPQELEEEVRLAYVGVTRAKKFLHLISTDSRVQYGQIKANPVSRIFRPFLDSHCQRVKN